MDDHNRICDSIDLVNTKLQLMNEITKNALMDLQIDVKDLRLQIDKLVEDQDKRIKQLEVTAGYAKGIVASAIFFIGLIGIKFATIINLAK